MAILRKIGRWTAGRLQGTKGTRKYDDWMKRNPWASTALGAGDLALAFYSPTLLKGAGKYLVGKSQAGSLGSSAGNLLQRGGQFLSGTPATEVSANPMLGETASRIIPATPNILERGATAAREAGRYMLDPKNALVTGQILTGIERGASSAMARRQERDAERERVRINRRMAELLMPMFTGMTGQSSGR